MRTEVNREYRESFIPIPNFDKAVSFGVSIRDSHQRVCGNGNHLRLIVLVQDYHRGSIQLESEWRHGSSFFPMKKSEGQSVGLAIGQEPIVHGDSG
jgi:hypothetical protein